MALADLIADETTMKWLRLIEQDVLAEDVFANVSQRLFDRLAGGYHSGDLMQLTLIMALALVKQQERIDRLVDIVYERLGEHPDHQAYRYVGKEG